MRTLRPFFCLLLPTLVLAACEQAPPQIDSPVEVQPEPSPVDYSFKLGTQVFDPKPGVERAFFDGFNQAVGDRQAGFAEAPAEAHLLIQLEEPMTREFSESLATDGIHVQSRVNAYTWTAMSGLAGAEALIGRPGVRWADLYPVNAKFSADALRPEPFEWQLRDGAKLAYSVLFHPDVAAAEVQALEEQIPGLVLENFDPETFGVVQAVLIQVPEGTLEQLAQFDGIRWIEPAPAPDEDDNALNAQPLSNVNVVQAAPYNLTGTGITVGIWESGDVVDTTPLDFGARINVQAGQVAGSDDHAVHVAGTLGGSGANVANAQGMATAVNIASWDANNDANEMTNAANSTGAAGQPTPIVLSNHSYGVGLGWNPAGTAFNANQNQFGQYTNLSLNFDNVVINSGLIIMKSAGNERDDIPAVPVPGQPSDCTQGGFAVQADCIGQRASAKNVITVGAMAGAGAITGFTSYGPTDDGRIKPDVMAHGNNIFSLACNCFDDRNGDGFDDVPNSTTATRTMSGTSMATPVVSGVGALLLEEAANQGIAITAEGMKALLVQTANDVAGVAQSQVGPDYSTGWGIVNAQAAADLLRLPSGPGLAQETINNTGPANGYTHSFFVPAGQPEVHVTLAWTDPAGNPANPGGVQLVNDLDLRLIAPDDTVTQPWTLNPAQPGNAATRNGGDDAINNVEQVSVLNPMGGVWTARVTAKAGSLVAGPQAFALAGPLTPVAGPIASTKADIMMVMDRSGSMSLNSGTPGLSKLGALQSAASQFVDFIELVGGHQVGLVQFDTNVSPFVPAFDLQALDAASGPDARARISGMTTGDWTNIIAGVSTAEAQLAGPLASNPERFVFLFSDGRHNRPVGSDVSDIDTIMGAATRFFAIGYGTDVDSTVMPGIATNHDGMYFEDQTLTSGQLAKMFLTIGGLTVNEDIVIDPDFSVQPGQTVEQALLVTHADRALTFALRWDSPNADLFDVNLRMPDGICKIRLRDHDRFAVRRGQRYLLVRVELPYYCESLARLQHAGKWALLARNRHDNAEPGKVMVLVRSEIGIEAGLAAKENLMRLTASLNVNGQRITENTRFLAALSRNRLPDGSSEEQDKAGQRNEPGQKPRYPGKWTGYRPEIDIFGLEPAAIPKLPPAQWHDSKQAGMPVQLLTGEQNIVELRDDGKNGDAVAGDGIYSAMIQAREKGLYQARILGALDTPRGEVNREKLASALVR